MKRIEITSDGRFLTHEETKQIRLCAQLWNRINKFAQKSSYRNRKLPILQKDIDKMRELRRKYIEERDKLRTMGVYEDPLGIIKDNTEAWRSD